jgi:adenylyltransferase/sulfurtransferase
MTPQPHEPGALNVAERSRYARHLALAEIGEAGQTRLKHSSVLLVGTGGLGSPAALYLAAAGVGHLGLVDFDTVDLSNLQRQVLFGTAQIGQSKAEAARERLLQLNPTVQITVHNTRLTAANARQLVAAYDVILDGTDRLPTRYLVNDACVLERRPLVSAAIHRFEGQAMTWVPDGKTPCYRCLFPAGEQAVVPNCADAGVLGVLPGVMGSLQATEALKLLLNIGKPLLGRLLVYDALSLSFQEFSFRRRTDCIVCGDHPTLTHLELEPENDMAAIDSWDAQQLAATLSGGNTHGLVMVDVREPYEWEAGRLPGSLHIPLGQLPGRLTEIPDGRVVFICAGGVRSLSACRIAAQSGRDTINLEGGIYGWADAFGPPPAP